MSVLTAAVSRKSGAVWLAAVVGAVGAVVRFADLADLVAGPVG